MATTLTKLIDLIERSLKRPVLFDDSDNDVMRPTNCLVFGQHGVGKFTQLEPLLKARHITFAVEDGKTYSKGPLVTIKDGEPINFQVLVIRHAHCLIMGKTADGDSRKFAYAASTLGKLNSNLRCVISLYSVAPVLLAQQATGDPTVNEIMSRFDYKAWVPAPVTERLVIFKGILAPGGKFEQHLKKSNTPYINTLTDADYERLDDASQYATPIVIREWCKHLCTDAQHLFVDMEERLAVNPIAGITPAVTIDSELLQSHLTHVGGHPDRPESLTIEDFKEAENPFAQSAGVALPKIMTKMEKIYHDTVREQREKQALEEAEKRIEQEDKLEAQKALAAGKEPPQKRTKLYQGEGLEEETVEQTWERLFALEKKGIDWKLQIWPALDLEEYDQRKAAFLAKQQETGAAPPAAAKE